MYIFFLYLRLMEEPTAYGKFGLANLLELREECLREFQFVDAYITIKQRLAFMQNKVGFSLFLLNLVGFSLLWGKFSDLWRNLFTPVIIYLLVQLL